MKTSELTGVALDWAVGTALGRVPKYDMESHGSTWYGWWLAGWGYEYERLPSYSSDWAQGGPIIEREGIYLWRPYGVNGAWSAKLDSWQPERVIHDDKPLIAAMRCYVASKLGDEVDVPDELLKGAEQ